MNSICHRNELPQTILSILPLTLFFPIGIIYVGILLFIFSFLYAGDYRKKWQTIKENPLFWPVVSLTAVTCWAAILMERPQALFWSGFAHYQIYIVLLLLISVGSGDWQKRAVIVFFIGAAYAATLYYLNFFQLLPLLEIFRSYLVYLGNKSISLAIMLAIAAGWMLHEMTSLTDRKWLWLRIFTFLYVVIALVFLAKSRTANLIFVLLCILVLLKHFTMSWRSVLWLLGFVIMFVAAWQSASDLRVRVIGTINDVYAFSQGEKISDEGIRLEMYSVTSQMIVDKPWTGHGIATWPSQYLKYAKGLPSAGTRTPHNDYLFYAAELGLIGLAALLSIWFTQLTVAWKIGGSHGMRLGMLGVAIMVAGMFNAVLRDAVFGMPFMILLAIPLAGVTRNHVRTI